jgi:RNA polymerase sigma factor (sigma-70 family)
VSFQSGGDENEIFGRLMDLFRPPLRGFFSRKGCQPEVCDDLIQDTFLGVVKGLGSLRSANAFTSWIFAIARNVYLRWWNEQHGFPIPSVDVGEDELGIMDPCPSPEDVATWREELRLAQSRILRFPPKRKRIFILKFFQGRENAEIAAMLGCTEITVRVQIGLARKQLEKFFARNRRGNGKGKKK